MSQLLSPKQLHDYQKQAVIHLLMNQYGMLWLDMGLGKTVITLTAMVDRKRAGQIQKILIFGPLRVIQAVWERESKKWEHTKGLRFSVIHGSPEKRLRAMFNDADVYLCNYENMNWLAQQLDHYYLSRGLPLPFQMVVYDEVSKLKNSTSLRVAGGKRDRKSGNGKTYAVKFTGWRKILHHFIYRVGLTGTPASNGYIDLHGQYLVVDGGQRLGEFVTHFRDSYFTSDYNGWKYTPTQIGKQWIEQHISDITLKMDAKDYLDLPEVNVVNMMVDLPAKALKHYQEVEQLLFTTLDSGREIELFSKSSVSNKCLQICNGTPYVNGVDMGQGSEAVHDAKLEALESILEEAAGKPVLCSYSFVSDAERIMKRFSEYKPVNLTKTPSTRTEKVINDWNAGKIRLMIGHPACLHPSTQVLTELRGWVRLIDVTKEDRVFDGVEFVTHDGCSYSGYKEVVDVFGVVMTPNHKLLIDNNWVEAKDVGTDRNTKRKALYEYQGNDCRIGEMLKLPARINDVETELHETQPKIKHSLFSLHQRYFSPVDQHPDMADMAGDEGSCQRLSGSQLRWKRYFNVPGVGELLGVLCRHARRILGRSDIGESRCESRLLQRELHLGDHLQTAKQQAQQQTTGVSGFRDALSRVVQGVRHQQDDVDYAVEPGNDGRRSGGRCESVTLWERQTGTEKSHVYDLVNCGPRSRFLIRNDDGEMFISHNSMGHGIDGLQENGSILVWFGMPWSLELYDQMNARLDRQGQRSSVSIIRILCRDTIDLVVADAIERKTDDQEGLKAALQRYRDGYTTNDLEVNFY